MTLPTGGADGFGLESAKIRLSQWPHVLLHGRYFDNDTGELLPLHLNATVPVGCDAVVAAIEGH